MTTNGRTVNGTKPEDLLSSLINLGKDVLDGCQEAIDRAMNQSMAIKEAEAKFGTPGTAGIDVRHEGLLRRENPQDRKRYEALKANRDRKILSARHINDLGGFAVNGQKYVMNVAEHLSDVTDALPEHLQPLGRTLTKASVQVLSGALVECLKFNAEMGFQEIAQATLPGQQQQ